MLYYQMFHELLINYSLLYQLSYVNSFFYKKSSPLNLLYIIYLLSLFINYRFSLLSKQGGSKSLTFLEPPHNKYFYNISYFFNNRPI